MMRRALTFLALVIALTTAQACGPDFFPDVFVRVARPDRPQRYASGHLGILQTGFPSADLFVAYRYLNGGTLTDAEKAGWSPTYPMSEQYYGDAALRPRYVEPQPDSAITNWTAARTQYFGALKEDVDPNLSLKITTPQGFTYNDVFPNCAADAFRKATETLHSRAALWGKSSPALVNWVQGQDAVFAACRAPASLPQPVPTGSPQLLHQDRAYQIAAAHFYGRSFDTAEQEFQTIAADKNSPWSTIAGYVAARVLIRKSFMENTGAEAPADFERNSMEAAGQQLRAFLAAGPPPPWKQAAEAQLALVRIRLEPETRTKELAALVAGPHEDPSYGQDVKDLLWVEGYRVSDELRADTQLWDVTKAADGTPVTRRLSAAEAEPLAEAKRMKAYLDTSAFRSLAPILDWTLTLRALSPENEDHALTQWQQTRSLPWLVAALMLASDHTAPSPALLRAAADVPSTSPAWETVSYHLARLRIAAGDLTAAKATIEMLESAQVRLPNGQQEPSTLNALHGLRMRAATDHAGLFSDGFRQLLLAASETSSSSNDCAEVMKHRSNWHRCISPGRQELDTDAARLFNERAPLTVWAEAATSTAIPQPLRRSIAMQGWTRATLLGDSASANTLQRMLPEPLQRELSDPTDLTRWSVLARNPGLQPYLDRGVQRAYSYDFVESYRLNWCYDPADYVTQQNVTTSLTAQELEAGRLQAATLSTMRSVDVGKKIVAAVKANPSDPNVAESLYLVLRMIRYGCNPLKEPGTQLDFTLSDLRPDLQTGEQLLQLRRETARLLRRYYASSPWTKKAAPFVGEVKPLQP